MKKKIIKTWNASESEYDYSIIQKYNIPTTLVTKYEGKNDIDEYNKLYDELDSQYKKPSWAGYMPKKIADNIMNGRFEIIESDEEFTTDTLSDIDMRNLADYLVPKLEVILKSLKEVQSTDSHKAKLLASSKAAKYFNLIKKIKK